MNPIAVITTVGSREAAQAMARALVARKLAACAQIDAIESFYTWDGALQNEPEFRITFKTTDAQYAALEAAIRELHSYALPAIHAVALSPVYAPYAQWIRDNSSAA
jgi:periplasmic divalent cation tolerance protein